MTDVRVGTEGYLQDESDHPEGKYNFLCRKLNSSRVYISPRLQVTEFKVIQE